MHAQLLQHDADQDQDNGEGNLHAFGHRPNPAGDQQQHDDGADQINDR